PIGARGAGSRRRRAASLPVRGPQCAEARSPSAASCVRVEQTTSRPAPARTESLRVSIPSKGRVHFSCRSLSAMLAASTSAMRLHLCALELGDGAVDHLEVVICQLAGGSLQRGKHVHPSLPPPHPSPDH